MLTSDIHTDWSRYLAAVAGHPATPVILWELKVLAVAALVLVLALLILDRALKIRLSPSRLTTPIIAVAEIPWNLVKGVISACDDLPTAIAALILNNRLRWLWLILVFAGVTVYGAYARPSHAITALCLGLLWFYGVFRLWSRDDKARARNAEYGDPEFPLRDPITHEVWMSALSLLAFVPLVFFQLDRLAQGHAFDIPGHHGRPEGYVVAFLSQLQRVIPLAGRLGMVGLQYAPDLRAVSPGATFTVFCFRVLGDLVVLLLILRLVDRFSRPNLRRHEADLSDPRREIALPALNGLMQAARQDDSLTALDHLIAAADPPPGRTADPMLTAYTALFLHEVAPAWPSLELHMLQTAEAGWRRASDRLIAGDDPDCEELCPEPHPYHYHHQLCDILISLSACLDPSDALAKLREAETAYRELLDAWPAETSPELWTRTQAALAGLFAITALHLDGDERLHALEQAAEAYRRTEVTATRKDQPQFWAAVQHNLGNVLTDIGDHLGAAGADAYAAAEQAYRNALLVYNRWLTAGDWALSHYNLGITLNNAAVEQPGVQALSKLAEAERAIRLALDIFDRRRERHATAAIRSMLGLVLSNQSERLDGPAGLDKLRRAERLFRQALAFYAAERHAAGEDLTRRRLDAVLALIAARQSGPSRPASPAFPPPAGTDIAPMRQYASRADSPRSGNRSLHRRRHAMTKALTGDGHAG